MYIPPKLRNVLAWQLTFKNSLSKQRRINEIRMTAMTAIHRAFVLRKSGSIHLCSMHDERCTHTPLNHHDEYTKRADHTCSFTKDHRLTCWPIGIFKSSFSLDFSPNFIHVYKCIYSIYLYLSKCID